MNIDGYANPEATAPSPSSNYGTDNGVTVHMGGERFDGLVAAGRSSARTACATCQVATHTELGDIARL